MNLQVGRLVDEVDRLDYSNNATIVLLLYFWADNGSSARAGAPGFVVVPTMSAWDCGGDCNAGSWYPVTARMPKPTTASAPMSAKIRIDVSPPKPKMRKTSRFVTGCHTAAEPYVARSSLRLENTPVA